MPQRITRSIVTLCAFSIFTAIVASAQSPDSIEVLTVPLGDARQGAQLSGPTSGKIFVVTFDQPQRRQTCHIVSLTGDKLVCSRALGGSRTYLVQQILALILPGDDALRYKLFVGFNLGLGAAIWGTVVLAAICPVCAAGTALVALFCFSAAGATAYGDGVSNRLLYLAPGSQLSDKLGYVQS
jgi:hypothetical protein